MKAGIGGGTQEDDILYRYIARWSTGGSLPVGHDDRPVVYSLGQSSVAARLFIAWSGLEHGEFLIEVPIQGKEHRERR